MHSLPACLKARSSILKWILEVSFVSFSHWAVHKNVREAVCTVINHLYIGLTYEFRITKQDCFFRNSLNFTEFYYKCNTSKSFTVEVEMSCLFLCRLTASLFQCIWFCNWERKLHVMFLWVSENLQFAEDMAAKWNEGMTG